METTFAGWPAEALTLLADIAGDNRAERWPELRDRYAAVVRGPTLALAEGLAAEFGPVRVFRPHVSRRFRPDAPPLRTDTGGVARSPGQCALAVTLSPTALTVTAGHWRFDRGQLRRYREAVDGGPAGSDPGRGSADGAAAAAWSTAMSRAAGTVDRARDGTRAADASSAAGAADRAHPPGSGAGVADGPVGPCLVGSDPGAELVEVLARLAADGLVPDPEAVLRGTPRGWRADHPRIVLARRRGLQVVLRWSLGPWVSTPEPLERVRAGWRAAAPLVDWLDRHVGAADPGPTTAQASPG